MYTMYDNMTMYHSVLQCMTMYEIVSQCITMYDKECTSANHKVTLNIVAGDADDFENTTCVESYNIFASQGSILMFL